MIGSPLQQLIVERIEREGAITFADYMRMALYEPAYGYYVGGKARVGWEGDFYTSTDVSEFFAHCMGRQLYQMWQRLGEPTPFVVLEQGAGRGALARGVRAWAAERAAFNAALDYREEDINRGHDALRSLDERSDSVTPAVVVSNELVDAFPMHIVEKRDGRLYEVYVTVRDGRLSEELAEPSSAEVAGYLDHYKVSWASFEDGWRAEVNLDALRWMERAAKLLRGHSERSSNRKKRGFVLTIDYGEKARALYARERRRGTLACYYRHHLTMQPLARPGEQDITAHVNFSALIEEGRRHGLRLRSFTTQEQWLKEMGIYEELAARRARDFAILDSDRGSDRGQVALLQWYNLRQQVTVLTDAGGMGNFKVLILQYPQTGSRRRN